MIKLQNINKKIKNVQVIDNISYEFKKEMYMVYMVIMGQERLCC